MRWRLAVVWASVALLGVLLTACISTMILHFIGPTEFPVVGAVGGIMALLLLRKFVWRDSSLMSHSRRARR